MTWSTTVEHRRIREVVTTVRETLLDEFERQLDKYGLYEDDFLPYSELSHLSVAERAQRYQLDRAIFQEAAGFRKPAVSDAGEPNTSPQTAQSSPLEALSNTVYTRAFESYVDEATQATLTRLLGLLVLEHRELVSEDVMLKPNSSDDPYVLSKVEEIAGELETTRDRGYPVALDLASRELATDLPSVFGPTRYTILLPEYAVLQDVIGELRRLNDGEIKHFEIDELFGWVYQYFGDEKRERLADQVNTNQHKLAGGELATSTQQFTPRYIVEWLVDNSLGRIWYETTDESTGVLDTCQYLAPHTDGLQRRQNRNPESVTIFDPACGGGHMLVYAFDVLREWYDATQPGLSDEDVVERILSNNLYGVDLDPGAAQLATLALYTKARTIAPDVSISQINVFATGGIEFTNEQTAALRDAAQNEVEHSLVELVAQEFHELSSKGSLARIAERIDTVISEQEGPIKLRPDAEAQLTDDGAEVSNQIVVDGESYARDDLRSLLLNRLREIVDEALETEAFDPLYQSELDTGVDLLDVMCNSYDVVVTNPPYLVSNKMDPDLKAALKDEFVGSRDIYAAFIERNLEFVASDGYVAMITMETFMFQYFFRKFRPWLLKNARFVDAAHIRNRDDGYMDVAFVYRQLQDQDAETQSQFIRIVDEPEPEQKKRATLQRHVDEIRQTESEPELPTTVSRVNQRRFLNIPRTRFLYWFGDEILNLFEEHDSLETYADLKVGLQTGDDDRFVRNWWELPGDARPPYPLGGEADQQQVESTEIKSEYRWFAQSGEDYEFLDPTTKLVRWGTDGAEIRSSDIDEYVRNEQYYGQSGVTFRLFSSYLTARIQPEGHFFGHTAHFVQAARSESTTSSTRIPQDDILLAYLNSSLARFIIDGFNPGLRYEVGDASNLPWKKFDSLDRGEDLAALAERAVEVQTDWFRLIESRPTFDPENFLDRIGSYLRERDFTRADLASIDGLIDETVFDEFGISEVTRERAVSSGDIPPSVHGLPHVKTVGPLSASEPVPRADIPTTARSTSEVDDLAERIAEAETTDVRTLAADLEVAPQTVALLRDRRNLYTEEEQREVASRLVSFCVGCAFGRWDLSSVDVDLSDNLTKRIEKISQDGIAAVDTETVGVEYDLSEVVLDLIDQVTDKTDLTPTTVEKWLGSSVSTWLDETYFEDYHCKEYKRRGERIPIYIQVSGDEGTVSWYLYYHALDEQSLNQLLTRVESIIETLRTRREHLDTESNADELAQVDAAIADLDSFRDYVDKAARTFTPATDDGIHEVLEYLDQFHLLSTPKERL